jgi:hypothetical protein
MTDRVKHNHNLYRKVYEQHYGPIPKDAYGRSYDIHHKDGNHKNNDPENLIALSVQDHYDLHYQQGDYAACYLIAHQRLHKSPEEISLLARRIALDRIKQGTNPIVVTSEKARQRALAIFSRGQHPFLEGKIQSESNRRRAQNGTHPNTNGALNKRLFAEGRHPSQLKKTCPYCSKTVGAPNYARYHGDKCKKTVII